MATDKRAQVAAQCKVVSHLASALSCVHDDYAALFHDGKMDNLIDLVGARTASFMEQLGDMLNAMDAVSEKDEWTDPVFAEARRLWPTPDCNLGTESGK